MPEDANIWLSFVFLAYAFLFEWAAIGAYRRYKTTKETTPEQAGRVVQAVHVHGGLDAAVRKTEDVIAAMKVGVSSIYRQDCETKFAVVSEGETESIEFTVANGQGEDDHVVISVASSSTPAGNSYRRNSANVLRFLERLAGVRVYQRKGNAAWAPARDAAVVNVGESERSPQASVVAAPPRPDAARLRVSARIGDFLRGAAKPHVRRAPHRPRGGGGSDRRSARHRDAS